MTADARRRAEKIVENCEHTRVIGGVVVYGSPGKPGACAECIAAALTEMHTTPATLTTSHVHCAACTAPQADPVCVFHGLKQSEHDCLYCCLCFKLLTVDECHVRPDGKPEDVCRDCAAKESR